MNDGGWEPLSGWIYATIRIVNSWGGGGTGFLVSRETAAGERAFLVTANHVLEGTERDLTTVDELTLHVNCRQPDGTTTGGEIPLALQAVDGSPRWRRHPDEQVDVLAMDITDVLLGDAGLRYRTVPFDEIVDADGREDLRIDIADDVLVIGYPSGVRHRWTNLPLVRSGIIASRIGEDLEVIRESSAKPEIVRGFLVDGGILRGSSGSPVVLKPTGGRPWGGGVILASIQPRLVGMITEHVSIPDPGYLPRLAGLGLAMSGDMIRETLILFK